MQEEIRERGSEVAREKTKERGGRSELGTKSA